MLLLVPSSTIGSPVGTNRNGLRILSHVICKQINRARKENDKKPDTWVPSVEQVFRRMVSAGAANEFQRIIGNYKPVLKALYEAKVLETDSWYVVGQKTIGYRLHQRLWNDDLVLHPVKMRNTKRTFYGLPEEWIRDPSNPYGISQVFLNSFDLDESNCEEINRICTASSGWSDLRKQQVARFYGTQWWSKVDEFGRYHTPLVSLHSEIRRLVTCCGEPLFEADFANFQPALLSKQLYWPISTDQRRRYEELCKNGLLYEALIEICPRLKTRAKAKDQFLKMLNREVAPMKKSSIYKAFRTRFPHFADALLEMKKNSHKEAALFLQRLESTVVFNDVIPRYRKLTNKPFFTVHDAVYVPHSAKEQITKALQSTIQSRSLPTTIKQPTPLPLMM